jgi:hypothetical protein
MSAREVPWCTYSPRHPDRWYASCTAVCDVSASRRRCIPIVDDNPRAIPESPPTDLRFGAAVVSDGGRYGVISELVPDMPGVPGGVRVTWDDDTAALIPRDAVAIEGDRIVVHTGDTDDARSLHGGEDLVVPIIEERITAEATWQEAGAITFRLRTAEEQRTVTARPAHEELEVEEVAMGRELAEGESVEPRTRRTRTARVKRE